MPDEVYQLAPWDYSRLAKLSREEVRKRVLSAWKFLRGIPFLLDPERLCPQCGGEWIYRHWRFWQYSHVDRAKHAFSKRCDVSAKCTSCSLTWTWGIPMSDEHYEEAASLLGLTARIGEPVSPGEVKSLLDS